MVKRGLLLLFLGIALPFFLSAQLVEDTSKPYFRYSAAAGGGGNQLYGDLKNKPVGPSAYLRGAYFIMHGIQVGVEFQGGVLRGEDNSAIGDMTRKTLNQYYAGIVDARVHPLHFFQKGHERRTEYRQPYGKRVLNSVYVGPGIGAMYNQQWNRQRPADLNDKDSPHYGKDEGFSLFVTGNLGFELPLHQLKPYLVDSRIWTLVVNGQANFAFDDNVDGYSGGGNANTSKDVFGVISVGVNLRF